jgi:hypothetical protein
VDSKGLIDAFFVRVSFKGLSELAIDSKGFIGRESGASTGIFRKSGI